VYNGHCYQGFGSTRTFADAEAACVIWGGNLVAINDEAERVFIYDNGGLGGGWNWIGLNDIAVEGTYVWTNGDPVTFIYSRSLVNTDAYDCVYQRNGAAQKGDWSAQPCTALHGYVCER
jgi:hypothetical protein